MIPAIASRERSVIPLILFGLSGFSALVYQVAWNRQLELVFGCTIYSVSTILAGSMAGLALGSLLGGRLARRTKNPLRLYGVLELGIAGLAALFPGVVRLMILIVERTELPIGPLRFALAAAILLPPTTLMGATFPVLCGAEDRGDAGWDVARLYSANLFGACLGVLASCYLLFAWIGLVGAQSLAVAVNLAAGLAALAVSRSVVPRPAAANRASTERGRWPISAAVGLSGLCGMAGEVLWTKLLVPSSNNSEYGFASVLFVYLLGLGAGSWLAGRSKADRPAVLGGVHLLAALFGYVGYRSFELTQLLQIRFFGTELSGIRPMLLAPLLEAIVLLFPLALMQGAVLPIAARLTAPKEPLGSAVSRLYFFNTVGAILGALAAGFWWIPAFGVQNALLIVCGLSLTIGAALIAWDAPRPWARVAVPVLAAAAAVLGWAPLRGRVLPAEMLLAANRAAVGAAVRLIYYSDDVQATTAVTSMQGTRSLIINGMGVTGYTNATKMLAHIPLLLHPKPERSLIICFGMGTTFRSALSHPGRVEAVDLVPAVFKTFPLFYPDAERLTADPRAALIVNDGRNYLLRAKEGYDVIVLDPSPPLYSAGTVNLYNRDFFALARRRLKPGGILAVWLPAYPESEFKMVMKSFLDALPHTQVWQASKVNDLGVILLGGESPIPIRRGQAAERLAREAVRRDMRELNDEFRGEADVWRLYMGSGERFQDYLADSRVVSDGYPWIEYPYFRALRRSYYRIPAIFSWPAVSAPRMAELRYNTGGVKH